MPERPRLCRLSAALIARSNSQRLAAPSLVGSLTHLNKPKFRLGLGAVTSTTIHQARRVDVEQLATDNSPLVNFYFTTPIALDVQLRQ